MASGNDVLESLGRNGLRDVEKQLVPMELKSGQLLHEADEKISDVYFPRTCIVSLVNEPTPGQVVEVATIGKEGVVGLPVILGQNAMSCRSLAQIPGDAYRMSVRDFKLLMEQNEKFRSVLMRYTLALFTQVAQNTSCNRLHEVQERCARWLLQSHDRVEGDSFALTQEFLGQMLGAQRPTVSVAAGMLQKAGLITYARGIITVLDRKGLERAACPCYGFVKSEYDRLLGAPA
jgi:CRP-like cAMP-binding protein